MSPAAVRQRNVIQQCPRLPLALRLLWRQPLRRRLGKVGRCLQLTVDSAPGLQLLIGPRGALGCTEVGCGRRVHTVLQCSTGIERRARGAIGPLRGALKV